MYFISIQIPLVVEMRATIFTVTLRFPKLIFYIVRGHNVTQRPKVFKADTQVFKADTIYIYTYIYTHIYFFSYCKYSRRLCSLEFPFHTDPIKSDFTDFQHVP